MALQTSGPISLLDIQNEFGGSNPISLSEYYSSDPRLPSSGTISLSNFYGKLALTEAQKKGTVSTPMTFVTSSNSNLGSVLSGAGIYFFAVIGGGGGGGVNDEDNRSGGNGVGGGGGACAAGCFYWDGSATLAFTAAGRGSRATSHGSGTAGGTSYLYTNGAVSLQASGGGAGVQTNNASYTVYGGGTALVYDRTGLKLVDGWGLTGGNSTVSYSAGCSGGGGVPWYNGNTGNTHANNTYRNSPGGGPFGYYYNIATSTNGSGTAITQTDTHYVAGYYHNSSNFGGGQPHRVTASGQATYAPNKDGKWLQGGGSYRNSDLGYTYGGGNGGYGGGGGGVFRDRGAVYAGYGGYGCMFWIKYA